MKCGSCGREVELRPTGTVGLSRHKKVARGDTILEWVLEATPEGAVNNPEFRGCTGTLDPATTQINPNLTHNVRGVTAEYRRRGAVVFRSKRGG